MNVSVSANQVLVVEYRDDLRSEFERLNREWIEQFFSVEEADKTVFADPRATVLLPGGQIFFVLEDGKAKGTCAVLQESEKTFELAKMAVTGSARGRGFGDLLMQAAIEFAKHAGAEALVLSSNSKLVPAIRLYEKYGFHPVPTISDERYNRVDIMMRLDLRRQEHGQ
jgi:putative acetyltransferase